MYFYKMNIRFLFLLLLCSFGNIFAQTTITGKIVDETNNLLEGAQVFFNNTTVGTTSNEKGEFNLKIDEGNYVLVVSFLGKKTVKIPINTSNKQSFLNITLQEDNNLLDEVVIKKTVYDKNWKYNLSLFKKAFLGRSKLAKTCKILNEKDLDFNYDIKTNTLTAFAKKPLQIKHNGLGYLITYDLVDFTLQKNQLFFSGYAHYKNLRKRIRKKWKQNRLKAYNGSQIHFFRSLMTKKLNNDGFVVHQFKRVLNPERPSEEQIKRAREIIQLNGGRIVHLKEGQKPKTMVDSAQIVLRKSRLAKYSDYLYKRNVPYKDIISLKNGKHILNFENYLMVIYKNEPEENNYLTKNFFNRAKKPNSVQTSHTTLLEAKAVLDKTGITVNPNAIFNEGYWAFEAFGDMLPLDYMPPKTK